MQAEESSCGMARQSQRAPRLTSQSPTLPADPPPPMPPPRAAMESGPATPARSGSPAGFGRLGMELELELQLRLEGNGTGSDSIEPPTGADL